MISRFCLRRLNIVCNQNAHFKKKLCLCLFRKLDIESGMEMEIIKSICICRDLYSL